MNAVAPESNARHRANADADARTTMLSTATPPGTGPVSKRWPRTPSDDNYGRTK